MKVHFPTDIGVSAQEDGMVLLTFVTEQAVQWVPREVSIAGSEHMPLEPPTRLIRLKVSIDVAEKLAHSIVKAADRACDLKICEAFNQISV